jgi:hypothetical protein
MGCGCQKNHNKGKEGYGLRDDEDPEFHRLKKVDMFGAEKED